MRALRRVGPGVLAALLMMMAGPGTPPAAAGAPTDQLRSSTDRVLKVLQDAELRKPGRTEERRKQIRTVANELFDWQETAKRALGRHWAPRNPQERTEFSALFADLIERSYVSKIEAYSGEKILYVAETVEGDQATVRTRMVSKTGTEIPIDYRMQQEGERWRAYDVLIEGVSLVANYRSQFNRLIIQSGYPELVKKLKAKQEEVEFDDAEQAKKKP
jgi:phospholipid transport system substrate-binding protein